MADIEDLNDWDKLGICWATGSWYAEQYFKARYSIPKLVDLGLLEVETRKAAGTTWDKVDTKMVRLTPAGVEMQAKIEASGFDKFFTWRKRA